nr:hypothetical protein [Tanacetum cinerariifolium]
MAKTINEEAQLHARVDGKKIIITEASIRRDLQLADKKGVDCLPNSIFFEQLALMGMRITAAHVYVNTAKLEVEVVGGGIRSQMGQVGGAGGGAEVAGGVAGFWRINDYFILNNDVGDEKDDINDAKTKSDKEDIYRYKIYVHKGVDKEMKDADTVEFRNDEREMNMAEDAGIEKIVEEKNDDTSAENAMATDLQTKETILVPLSLMDVLIQHDTPQLQSPSALKVPVSVIQETTTLTHILEILIETPVTTVPPPPPSISTLLRVVELEKEVSELKKSDISKEILAYLKSQVPQVVNDFLESRLEDDQDDLSSDGESQEGDVANKADNNKSDVDRVSESSFMHENDTAHKDVNSCKKGEVNKARADMSSASSAVTYTSVYTDFELERVIWGADKELSDGAPQDEDEHELIFIQPHDPDFMQEPIYPEYIPLEDEHILLAKEQPLPPVVSPTAESPGYVAESDLEEDPKKYEEDETEGGLVDYPMDGGDDGDDDDGNSSGYKADDEDEDEDEEEEHLAPADSAIVIPIVELVSQPKGTKPTIPPPSTNTTTTGAKISI